MRIILLALALPLAACVEEERVEHTLSWTTSSEVGLCQGVALYVNSSGSYTFEGDFECNDSVGITWTRVAPYDVRLAAWKVVTDVCTQLLCEDENPHLEHETVAKVTGKLDLLNGSTSFVIVPD